MKVLSKEQEEFLKELYYEKKMFFGRDKLHKYIMDNHSDMKITRRPLMAWLKNQELHQMTRQPPPTRDKLNHTILKRPFSQLAMDITDIQTISRNGFKYLLTIIDIFTKYAWVYPMKSKTEQEVLKNVKKLIEKDIQEKPSSIRSDNGSEFTNKSMKKYLENKNIKQIFSLAYTPQSNGAIERFNKTLKSVITKTLINSDEWIDDLSDIVKNYNSTIHSTTNKTPEEALTANKNEIMQHTKKKLVKEVQNPDVFAVGDIVRIQQSKQKGQTYSKELYIIRKITKAGELTKASYLLKDTEGNDLKNKYYKGDLIKIDQVENEKQEDKRYYVSSLVRPSVQNNKAGYIVRWKGYSEKDNTWEPIERLKQDIPKELERFNKKNDVKWVVKNGKIKIYWKKY